MIEDNSKMKELVNKINYYSYQYYVLDNPIISDAEWDKLYDELLMLEKETGVVLENSPSKKVGGEILKGFKKVEHKFPLYSLEKCNSELTLQKWIENIKKEVLDAKFLVGYKYDGLTITLKYVNGKFVQGATRGNGIFGEDVTEQVKTIRTVPLSIPFKGEVIVQGEGIMKLSELEKYNRKSNEPLKNARNAVAGAIRNLDPKETKKRNLDVVCYNVVFCENKEFETQNEMLEFIKANGFLTSIDEQLFDNFEDIFKRINEIDNNKKFLDFLIDGAVVKLNDVKARDKFGYTAKHPKFSIAYKFAPEEQSALLKDVIWQVGRTGKITPGAIISPVELSGATVTKATLNNYGDILRKKVKLNSYVFVRRSNEVIPEILGLAHETENSKEIEKPQFCPSCNSELKEIGANLFCLNTFDCPEQIIERISHYCSRDAMNVEGVSEKTAKILMNKLNVKTIAGLYDLKVEDLLNLEGFKQKKAQNAIDAIEKSKNVNLAEFIYAIGILNVGKKTAKDLANNFKTFERIKNASFEQLCNIENVGEIIAQNIIDYFSNEKNTEILNKLFEKGVIVNEKCDNIKHNELTNKTIVLTGTLQNYGREEMTKLLEQYGVNVTSGVSAKTDFVLAGENAGSKLAKAKQLGIAIITEKEIEKWL